MVSLMLVVRIEQKIELIWTNEKCTVVWDAKKKLMKGM